MLDDLLLQLNGQINSINEDVLHLNHHIKKTKEVCKIQEQNEPTLKQETFNQTFTKESRLIFFVIYRFKQQNDDDYSFISYSTDASFNLTKTRTQGVKFANQKRFQNKYVDMKQALNPNIDAIKKCPKNIAIPKEKRVKIQKDINHIGPGEYENKQAQIKNIAIGQETRFKQEEMDNKLPLNIDDNIIKKAVPNVIIKQNLQKTKQLQQRDTKIEIQEIRKAEQYFKMNLDIKQHVPSIQYFKSYLDPKNMTEKEKLIRLFHLFRKKQRLGPGAYEIQKDFIGKCMVVYKSASPTKARLPNMKKTPGPAHYYAQDDMCFNAAPKITFTKEIKHKIESIDKKEFLDVNLEAVKQRQPVGLILPEHQPKQVTYEDLLEIKRGPGQQDVIFDQIETRADIGLVQFQQITDKNDRINNIHEKKEINDAYYEPNYDFEKPNHNADYKYHEDTNIQPQHIPDKELYPERHQFYDVNLDAIKEDIGKVNNFAQNMQFQDFNDHQREQEIFSKIQKEQIKVPEPYDIQYTQIDNHLQNIDFKNQQERQFVNTDKVEEEMILNPQPIQSHVQGVDFQKQIGRDDFGFDEFNDKIELILNPNYELTEKRVVGMVEMQKQLDRPQSPQKLEEELVLDLQYQQVEKNIQGYDFGKDTDRFEDIQKNDQELIIDKNFVQVEKANICQVKMVQKTQSKFTLKKRKNFN